MLIDRSYVYKYFPLWSKFFVDPDGQANPVILDNEILLAELEFGDYLVRTESTITEREKIYLLNILKMRGFNRLHGDTAFETKPQIVKDYENTMKLLERIAAPWLITANQKKFTGGNWFNDM